MVTFEQALKNILKNARVLPAEKVAIEDSAGRILEEDIYSGLEMPPFDKSAMDGYALKAVDVENVPVKLRCIGLIQAGGVFSRKVKKGECVKIMTGAAIPKGSNSVVMVEDTAEVRKQKTGGARDIEILQKVKKGENVCRQGEDICRGQKILSKGILLSPAHIGILAALGLPSVKVTSKPVVAVMNTGGEIVPIGAKLRRNEIYNSNGPQIMSMLKRDRIKPVYLGIAKDTPRDLKKLIREGLKYDILLISGGVSMGDYDLVPEILKESGVKEVFYKVKIKPGKPLFFGVKGKTLVFGVPGNPVSNFTTYLLFVRTAICKMSGYKNPRLYWQEGVLNDSFNNFSDRLHFVPVAVDYAPGRLTLNLLNSHGSADVFALSKAQGFMMVKPGKYLKKGAKVKFIENHG